MPDETKEAKDELSLLRSLPVDESTEERVESLWRQLMLYKSSADSELSEARARRAQAEAAREEAELEAIRMTEAVCERMRAKSQRELEEAQNLKAEAAKARQDAQAELDRAKETKSQAEKERDQTMPTLRKTARAFLTRPA